MVSRAFRGKLRRHDWLDSSPVHKVSSEFRSFIHLTTSNPCRPRDSEYILSQNASTSDSEPAPELPEFRFPSAAPLEYKLHLGEKGHSYVKATLTYETCAPPGQPTLVNVQLECVGTSDRCISSVSLKITSPDQTVKDVKSPEAKKFASQNSVHVEDTKRQTTEHHGGAHLAPPRFPWAWTPVGQSRTRRFTSSRVHGSPRCTSKARCIARIRRIGSLMAQEVWASGIVCPMSCKACRLFWRKNRPSSCTNAT
ncbi:hypothetical protein K438DRAFT_79476 [Mycena galopus ATCC 62051]|nr:hypothetical protein K438DRAFT_79476 [Mycena galopus ATCC 62051]